MKPFPKWFVSGKATDLWRFESIPSNIKNLLREFETEIHDAFKNKEEDSLVWRLVESDLSEAVCHMSARCWHYSRLTASEIRAFSTGIRECSKNFRAERLEAVVSDGLLSDSDIETILQNNPLIDAAQRRGRLGNFCAISAPVSTSDSGIEPLVSKWGGEVVGFWLGNFPDLLFKLKRIGEPSIVELDVPVSTTDDLSDYIYCILHSYGRELGFKRHFPLRDIFIKRNHSSVQVRRIHIRGDEKFAFLSDINCHIRSYWRHSQSNQEN